MGAVLQAQEGVVMKEHLELAVTKPTSTVSFALRNDAEDKAVSYTHLLLEERFSVKVHFDEIKTIYKERPIKKVNKIIQIEVPPNPCLLYTSAATRR